jgi:hypothetical protein
MKKYQVAGGILLLGLITGGFIFYNNSSDVTHEVTGEPKLKHVHGFAVDLEDSERLLIATHHGLLELKDNNLSQVGSITDDLMGFTPHPTDSSIFFSSGHSTRGGNLGFQRSVDAGLTWEKVSAGLRGPVDFHSLTVSAVNPDIVYGYFNGLQRSLDAGLTWDWTESKIQPHSLSTDPQDENVVYAATSVGVIVSRDRGDTWENLSEALLGEVSVFSMSPNGTEALTFSQALGGLGKSMDSGLTWERIGEGFGGAMVTHIAYSKSTPSIVYSFNQSNSIYKSLDSGDTWTKLR